MESPDIGRTASKRTVGSLNELMHHLTHQLRWYPESTVIEHTLRLAETPMKGVEYNAPDRATLALFEAAAALSISRTRSDP